MFFSVMDCWNLFIQLSNSERTLAFIRIITRSQGVSKGGHGSHICGVWRGRRECSSSPCIGPTKESPAGWKRLSWWLWERKKWRRGHDFHSRKRVPLLWNAQCVCMSVRVCVPDIDSRMSICHQAALGPWDNNEKKNRTFKSVCANKQFFSRL